MSKVLIIHPQDSSTHFLDIVYNPIPDKTVITGGISKKEVLELIESHEQVMMMGHGTPFGLMDVGRFKTDNGFIIDRNMVEALSKKDNSVYIWCNANQFVDYYKLKGFYTGMFISEVGEANYCGLPGTKQPVVDESNLLFCNVLSEVINESTKTMFEKVTDVYGNLAVTNPVADYNNKRLYLNE